MVFPNQGYQAYQKNKYETASPHRLILYLYVGAIRYGTQAIKAIEEADISATHANITKTQDILYELIACLDLKQGGDIAANLHSLYMYMINRLLHANIHRNVEAVQEVLVLLADIKAAWEEMGKEVSLGTQSR